MLFYSRDQNGEVDPYSWHGGAAVLGTGKWTLQKFKEVPREHRANFDSLRSYVEAKHRLLAAGTNGVNYIIHNKMS